MNASFANTFSVSLKVVFSLFLIFLSIGLIYLVFDLATKNYLYTAYAATWLIHVGYLATLVRRYARLKREMEELKKK